MKAVLGLNQLPTVILFHVEQGTVLYRIKKCRVKFLCFTKLALIGKAEGRVG